MVDPKSFFDELMSPFLFLPLLEFTFEGGQHTKFGADFLTVFFYNMYVAEPQHAILDVMEINFGFQIQSIANIQVNPPKQPNADGGESPSSGGDSNSPSQPMSCAGGFPPEDGVDDGSEKSDPSTSATTDSKSKEDSKSSDENA